MTAPTNLPAGFRPRTARDQLSVHYTKLVNEMWPDLTPNERRRLRRATTEVGLREVIASIKAARS